MANNPQKKSHAQQKASAHKRGGRYSQPQRGPNVAVVVAVCLAAIAITAGLIAGCFYLMNPDSAPQQILANVSILGVDVGGMTEQVAKYAVEAAVSKTYSQKNMTVTVGSESIEIPPSESKITIDVDAAVKAAYAYGHTGSAVQQQQEQMQALQKGYAVDPSLFMKLNTDAIRTRINQLGENYSSLFSQSGYEIRGQ